MNLGDIPRRNAYRYPEQLALSSGESAALDWSELNVRVNRLANVLQSLGLRKCDRLAILSAPRIEVALTYFAAAKIGLIIVPIHTGLVEGEVKFLLDDVGARAIVVEQELMGSFRAAISAVSTIEHVIQVGGESGHSFESLLQGGEASEPSVSIEETDLFAIRFTSGTTGRPKGCPSTHKDWLRRSINFLAHVPHSHHDRPLLLSPLSLGVGSSMLMSYSLVGASMILKPRFDAADALRTISAERITTFARN
jgi:acyl-CoA synthetase (AMP-forming)/AMP-acid ligase II